MGRQGPLGFRSALKARGGCLAMLPTLKCIQKTRPRAQAKHQHAYLFATCPRFRHRTLSGAQSLFGTAGSEGLWGWMCPQENISQFVFASPQALRGPMSMGFVGHLIWGPCSEPVVDLSQLMESSAPEASNEGRPAVNTSMTSQWLQQALWQCLFGKVLMSKLVQVQTRCGHWLGSPQVVCLAIFQH